MMRPSEPPISTDIRARLLQQAQPSPTQPHVQVRRYHAAQPDAGSALELAALVRRDDSPVLVISARGDIGTIILGRGDDADVRLAAAVVSQVHARLAWDAEREGHVLTDCGSTNGTYVNRRRISGPVMLLNGMRIHLGSVELSYRYPYHPPPVPESASS